MSFSVPTRNTLSWAWACGAPPRSDKAANNTSNKRVNDDATGITILSTCKTSLDVTRRRHPIARVKSSEPLIVREKGGNVRALCVQGCFLQFMVCCASGRLWLACLEGAENLLAGGACSRAPILLCGLSSRLERCDDGGRRIGLDRHASLAHALMVLLQPAGQSEPYLGLGLPPGGIDRVA